jgi:nitroreductase
MELLEAMRKRFSVRRYLPKPVEREKLLYCVEAARLAPSACNIQPWKFVIVDDPETKRRLAEEAFSGIHSFNQFAKDAAAVVVVVAEEDFKTNKLFASMQGTQFYLLDLGCACEHFILAAAAQGLGTCWLGWFSEKRVKKLLGIPRSKKAAALISVGYYDQAAPPPEKKRKGVDVIVSFNTYSPHTY